MEMATLTEKMQRVSLGGFFAAMGISAIDHARNTDIYTGIFTNPLSGTTEQFHVVDSYGRRTIRINPHMPDGRVGEISLHDLNSDGFIDHSAGDDALRLYPNSRPHGIDHFANQELNPKYNQSEFQELYTAVLDSKDFLLHTQKP